MEEEIAKMDENQLANTGSAYSKQKSNVNTNQITVDGKTLRFRSIDLMKEKNGVKMPHQVNQIHCSPPAPIELVKEHSTIKERIND